MANDSIIIWDDHDPPSSPFMTEISDTSRQISKSMQVTTALDPEFEAIFNETTLSPVAQTFQMSDADKENYGTQGGTPGKLSETPLRALPEKTGTGTAARKTGRGQMLPPSTTKRASSPPAMSTAKKSTTQTRLEEYTPSRPKLARGDTSGSAPMSDLPSIDETNIDDTCFSTFSAVPDMTLFAKLGQSSPTKSIATDHATPRAAPKKRISPSRSPSPTPQRRKSQEGETTSLLIDFTQQMDMFAAPARSPHKSTILSPSRTEPHLLTQLNAARSPARRHQRPSTLSQSPSKSSLMNLLDFELPPPPTPRSAPQFTAREVESLKSNFTSQLSSLKAKLSGREAEVDALKKALEDAERRVGEAQEEARAEKSKREETERERLGWEERGREVERVLGTVREEVMKAEGERESLERRTAEAEERVREVEGRNAELLAQVLGSGNGEGGEEVQRLVQMQLDARIEGVSRELHAVYKKKHESKVATLKKSYEARGERRCAELQEKLDEALRANEELRTAKDETFSGDLGKAGDGKMLAELEEKRAEVQERDAQLAGLESEFESFRADFARLQTELEAERVEKGELVAAVDEMLSLQATDSVSQGMVEDFRKSLSRPSALRVPIAGVHGESKVAKPSGLARPGIGKSKMMSNIERTGGGRAAE